MRHVRRGGKDIVMRLRLPKASSAEYQQAIPISVPRDTWGAGAPAAGPCHVQQRCGAGPCDTKSEPDEGVWRYIVSVSIWLDPDRFVMVGANGLRLASASLD
jgi:hypothetical protein